MLGRGPREGGSGQLFPSRSLGAVSGGARQGWGAPAGERRTEPALRSSLAAGGTAGCPAGPRRRGQGPGEPLGLGGVAGSRGGRGALCRGRGGRAPGLLRGAGVGAENEWRLPAGVRGPLPRCVRAVPPWRRETFSSGRRRRLLGDRCLRGRSWAPVHSFGDWRVKSLQSERSLGIKSARCPCKEFCSVCS